MLSLLVSSIFFSLWISNYNIILFLVFEPTIKDGKNTKAERKARSRGVSGSSSRKDGNRFEHGLDCIDFAYERNPVKDDGDMSSDEDEEYFEYDMVVTSNVPKIRSAIIDFLNNGNIEEAVVSFFYIFFKELKSILILFIGCNW